MKILLSSVYSEWRASNKDTRAADVVDRFLCQIHRAANRSEVKDHKRLATNHLLKKKNVKYKNVREYEIGWNYRIYGHFVKTDDGQDCFCLAMFGNKADKGQSDAILDAIMLFNDTDPNQWPQWEPSPELLKKFSSTENTDAGDEQSGADEDSEPAEIPAPAQSAKAKKGKPLDENGLTPAERKKQQQEEQKRRREEVRKAAQERRKEKVEKEMPANVAPAEPVVTESDTNAPALVPTDNAPADDITDDEVRILGSKATDKAAPALVPADNAPADDITDDEVRILGPKATDKAAPALVPTDNAPADDITDDEVRILGPKATDKAAVATSEQTRPVEHAPEFKDYADVQYQLDILEHQMVIEKLHIKASQFEIGIENLEIKRLQLLQQKNQNPDGNAAAVPEFTDYADVQYQLNTIERQITIEKLNIKKTAHEITLEEMLIKKLQLLQKMKGR